MKPEQAPIEIAKELHELNKKLNKIIDILSTTAGVLPTQKVMRAEDIVKFDSYYGDEMLSEPTVHVGTLDGEPDHFITGNPEAHDYGSRYLYEENKHA